MDVYPSPPRDALGELIATVTAPDPAPAPLAVTRRAPPPRWPVAPLPDVAAVATLLGWSFDELDWFADLRRQERTVTDEALRHYRYTWLAKPGRAPRLIEAPKPRLRYAQRRILRSVLDPVATSDAAHGFVRRRSVVTAAAPHVGRPVLLHLDLETFFGSIPAARVAGLFRLLGYPEAVARVLAGLTTNTTPAPVRSAMPATGPDLADTRWRLGRRLATAHLPQGAPTSPAVANLLCYRLDRRLTGLARSYGATYTRYADDLIFSGDHGLRADRRLVEVVRDVVATEGFHLAHGKTRRSMASERQLICGVVVNERISVPRDEYDRLKALLHNAARTGLAAQNRDGVPNFREHLAGRIAWVSLRHRGRGARLAVTLAACAD